MPVSFWQKRLCASPVHIVVLPDKKPKKNYYLVKPLLKLDLAGVESVKSGFSAACLFRWNLEIDQVHSDFAENDRQGADFVLAIASRAKQLLILFI